MKNINLEESWYQGCASQIRGSEEAKMQKLQELEESGLYVAQTKSDGNWGIVFGMPDGNHIRNRKRRHISKYALPYVGEGNAPLGELGYGSQSAKMKRNRIGHNFIEVFDMLWCQGRYIGDEKEWHRHASLVRWLASLDEETRKHYILLPRWEEDFVRRYKESGEGLVLKLKDNGIYHPGTKSTKWIKCKKEIEEDMVILDWRPSSAKTKQGMAKSIKVGQYVDGELKGMVWVGSLTKKMNIEVAEDFEKFRGRVIEVKGYYPRFKSGSIRHPSFIRFRDDKPAEECTFDGVRDVELDWEEE